LISNSDSRLNAYVYIVCRDENISRIPVDSTIPLDEKLDVKTALRRALNSAIIMDGVAKGLHEAAKALDKYGFNVIFIVITSSLLNAGEKLRQAYFCVLAENCDEPMYTKLVEALCNEHQIPLIKMKDKKQLGEWVGLCKYDKEGKARKAEFTYLLKNRNYSLFFYFSIFINVVGCSCVVVRDYGQDDAARVFLQDYFSSQGKG
uniref:40S ribosomal protein S12 n=1 Tax=Thelazia callipaeda TaxID=103827 RepID=A0A0N5CN38_THECL